MAPGWGLSRGSNTAHELKLSLALGHARLLPVSQMLAKSSELLSLNPLPPFSSIDSSHFHVSGKHKNWMISLSKSQLYEWAFPASPHAVPGYHKASP